MIKKNRYCAYISKHNSDHEKNHSFNGSKRRSMTLSCNKEFSDLLRGITSKRDRYWNLFEFSSFF